MDETSHTRHEATLGSRLLEIVICPLTKAPLEYDRDAGELISREAGLAYPVRDGVPIMLPTRRGSWSEVDPRVGTTGTGCLGGSGAVPGFQSH
jgi:uncharacterized protein YbaR (Trm112 family)